MEIRNIFYYFMFYVVLCLTGAEDNFYGIDVYDECN